MIEVGTKIIGNFGAMIPLSFGEVVTIDPDDTGLSTLDVKVKWDNGSITWIMESEIDAAVGKLSPKAAALLPIGYYTEKVYYET